MLKQARKIARDSLFSGLMLTVIVVVAAAGGLLENMERWLYDKRCATCQFFTPPPTDKLVHFDIDNAVLDTIGRWPWDRGVLAEMFDELRLAGPKVVATDVLLSEPQKPQLVRRPAVPGQPEEVDEIRDDTLLAESIRKLGCVIVPMSLPFLETPKLNPLQEQMRAMLHADPELSEPELVERLTATSLGSTAAATQSAVARDFLSVRREAINTRIREEMLSAPGPMDEVRAAC